MTKESRTDIKLLAFDLGAESGRAMVGHFDGSHIQLEQVHRFANGPVRVGGSLYTDALYIWDQMQIGLQKAAAQYGKNLVSVGVDTWGVDFALLDGRNNLLGNPHHYRDHRTDGMIELACSIVPQDEIYSQTGNQFMQFNTLFQLYSLVRNDPNILLTAGSLLMLPDLFHFWLCGERANEYSVATTSQCYDQQKKDWAWDLIGQLGIPAGIFQPVIQPGQKIGSLHTWLATAAGCPQLTVVVPASHDTGSAVTAVPVSGSDFMYISSGTWSLVGVELDQPCITAQSLAYNLTNEGNPGGRTRFLKVVPGMWLLQQSRNEWARAGRNYSYEELTNLAASAPACGSMVDITAPEFIDPGDMPARIRSFCQETRQPIPQTDGEVARCILESLAYQYRSLLEDFELVLGKRLTVVHIIGGGSKNDLLNQITSNCVNRPVIAGPVEATAIGNLLMQALGLGYLSTVKEIRQVIRSSFQPVIFEPHHSLQWEEGYQRYRQLSRLLRHR
jgi:sugar (pentulose or hexulose) kinase